MNSKSVTYARISSQQKRKLAPRSAKAAGSPAEDVQPASAALEDEEAKKRRNVLQEAVEMDKDADSDEGDGESANGSKGNAKCAMHCVIILV